MRADRLIRSLLRERFVITLLTGESFDGLLIDADDRLVIFADAAQLASNGARLPVDGELYVERARIAYMQRPRLREASA